MNKLFVLFGILLLTSCSAKQEYLKTHSLNALTKEDVAILKPTNTILVHEIDSVKTNIVEFTITEHEIEVLPGIHVLELSFYGWESQSLTPLKIAVNVEAGRKYLIKSNSKSEREHWWLKKEHSWKPSLLDVTDRPQCWTSRAGSMFGPKGCD